MIFVNRQLGENVRALVVDVGEHGRHGPLQGAAEQRDPDPDLGLDHAAAARLARGLEPHLALYANAVA
jgi:hypothetical protein